MATVSLPPQLLTRLMTSERSLTSWPVVLKRLSWGPSSDLRLTGWPCLMKIPRDPLTTISTCRPTHPVLACTAASPAAHAATAHPAFSPPMPAWPQTATVPPASAPVSARHGPLTPHPPRVASAPVPSPWTPSSPLCAVGATVAIGATASRPPPAPCLLAPLRLHCPAPVPLPAAAPAREATVKSQTWASLDRPAHAAAWGTWELS